MIIFYTNNEPNKKIIKLKLKSLTYLIKRIELKFTIISYTHVSKTKHEHELLTLIISAQKIVGHV
jgi:hypothetical protein